MRDPSARFSRYLQRWWTAQHDAADDAGWARDRDVDHLAREFRRDAQFELSQARFLIRRPDEQTARRVVDGLSPEPSENDKALLAEAIVRAGSTAQKVRTTTALGAMVTIVALVVRNILRGR